MQAFCYISNFLISYVLPPFSLLLDDFSGTDKTAMKLVPFGDMIDLCVDFYLKTTFKKKLNVQLKVMACLYFDTHTHACMCAPPPLLFSFSQVTIGLKAWGSENNELP